MARGESRGGKEVRGVWEEVRVGACGGVVRSEEEEELRVEVSVKV